MQFATPTRVFCGILLSLIFLPTPRIAYAHGVLPSQNPAPLVDHLAGQRRSSDLLRG